MTEQEKINSEVQTKLALQDAKFNVFMQEMRDRDNQRAEDIREIRTSLQSLQSSGRTLNVATIIGIAAIVIAVLLK
ncbi:MAG: hypothetical protein II968_01555 [Selenomonadaceae bacterium]|nr:hypothetical protein [Selenomonadaceae bacterium]